MVIQSFNDVLNYNLHLVNKNSTGKKRTPPDDVKTFLKYDIYIKQKKKTMNSTYCFTASCTR